jgi:3-carboxy-cis,cis-muconate cycloisomerase
VPLAIEGMLHDHEVSGAYSSIMDTAVLRACVLTGDMLTRLRVILHGLMLDPDRMRRNLELTHGLIMSEAVMLELGEAIGRQHAHEIVYAAAQSAAVGDQSFRQALLANAEVKKHIKRIELERLLDPASYVGLSVEISKDAAKRARAIAKQISQSESVVQAIS